MKIFNMMYKISLAIFQSKNRFIRLVVQIVIKKQSVSYYQDNVGLQHFVLCVCDRRWRFQQDCQTVNRVRISCRVWNTEGIACLCFILHRLVFWFVLQSQQKSLLKLVGLLWLQVRLDFRPRDNLWQEKVFFLFG